MQMSLNVLLDGFLDLAQLTQIGIILLDPKMYSLLGGGGKKQFQTGQWLHKKVSGKASCTPCF